PPKLAPAKEFKTTTEGVSSVYPIRIRPNSKAYRYDVDIIRHGQRDVPLTKGSVDDGERSLNRRLCCDLLITMYSKTRGFGTQGNLDYVYDGRKNLYTNMLINFPPGKKSAVIKPGEMNDFCKKYLFNSEVEIFLQESESFELDLTDFMPSLAIDVDKQANRDLRTFLELLTSQHAVNSQEYASVGVGKLFENNPEKFIPSANGIVIRTGIAKGVRIIENNRNPCPALVVDGKFEIY
uniref:Uncharacterized protein n=1 Tax=Acrobeloides nanus TaxID=290746 RepID=A0A914CYM2_9BILA